jgi:hypothetical protein
MISFHSSRLLQGFSVKLPIATQFNFNRTNSTQAAYLEASIPPLGSGVQGALKYDARRCNFCVIPHVPRVCLRLAFPLRCHSLIPAHL